MKTHLSAQEFVDALEGKLRDDRRAHAASCEACTHQLADMAAVTREAHDAGTVPEPSPLFWDHFSARVRVVTEAEPVRPAAWWDRAWRPVAAFGAVAAAALIALVMFNGRTMPATPASSSTTGGATAVATVEPAIDDASLELMVQMATGLPNEDLQSARPGKDATAAMIDELTPAQQAEFIRLIKAEIGDFQ